MKERRIEWSEIADNAEEMFLLPFGIRELEWAELAWNALSLRYLTVYHNELERHIVLTRLITLATLFHEFAYLAWDWRYDPYEDYVKWANGLGLHALRIGQLVGAHFFIDRRIDDSQLLRRAIEMLVEAERKTVHRALDMHFKSHTLLFASLYSTAWSVNVERDGNEPDDWPSIDDILSSDELLDIMLNSENVEDGMARAFLWIVSGMPPVIPRLY